MLETAPQTKAAPPAAATPEPRAASKRQELLRVLTGDSELLLKNRLEARHLMTRDPITVPPTATIEEMSDLMKRHRIRHLLVCGLGGALSGVVSERDLRAGRAATARQVMSYPPLTCAPDTPLGAAISYLLHENISCLPVVENGLPCGVLTTTDLALTLQCTLQLWPRLAQVLQHDARWAKELEKIAASLDGELTAAELAERIAAARLAIRREIQGLANLIDLRADAQTGMSNRQDLVEILGMLLAMKRRYGRPFSLAVVTIDHFDRIRANCGEAVTAPLVKAVARLVESAARASDFIARSRDDSFAVVLTETDLAAAETFCRRVREAARDRSRLDVELRVTVRAVEAAPEDDPATLLARAERE